ncbi:uncharacterized protein LOC120479192 [Pimephales promelas]|uniref:uncharacterized protein LOC120479192 n=1 Tax=Pimephales promelas TaxID=90988 RepID=UPI00195578C7|nr:uncharacterized protein LOC120479192 [Pimephales promelas]
MEGQAEKRQKSNRRIIHCLLCGKPQEMLSTHLSRVCMKKNTPEERMEETNRAKESAKAWTRQARNWDYKEMVKRYPHRPSRLALLKELCQRDFFVANAPEQADLDSEEASTSTAGEPSGAAGGHSEAAVVSSLTRSSSDDSGEEGTQAVKRRRVEEEVGSPAPDFNAFLQAFPVGITGQPPNKTQREKAGFPADRVFYDKWRALQYSLREQHLLSKFSRRTPTAAMVAKVIDAEGWTANHPRPEDIMAKWRPLSRAQAESDPCIIKGVTRQKWSGLAVKAFGEQKGVVATKAFGKGSILCDFHGKVITGAEGREMAETQDQLGNLFFFKHGPDEICIDAETFPCECHPSLETIGRWITHSKKKHNVQPCHCIVKLQGGDRHVLLFQATTDIKKDDKICFDHGIKKRTFRGEIEELEWLNI